MHILLIDRSRGKARKRSMTLLDSYALRTGEASWSTPITREALEELKQALRRIASRNTCVGCYLSIGRARMRLAWVIGRSSEFESHGATPVAQTRRKRKPFVPVWIRRIALLAAAAGHAHDIGKASRLFQAKLRARPGMQQIDRVRHEWLSVQVWRRLREGRSWREAWRLGGAEGRAMTELPPFMRQGITGAHDAVDFLIASHHRLFGQPVEGVTNPADSAMAAMPDSGLHVRREPSFPDKMFEPEAALEPRRLQAGTTAERRLLSLTPTDREPAAWWGTSLFARAALIFADHSVSAIEKPDPKARLHANTLRNSQGKRNRLNQSLPWHLDSVGSMAGDVAVKMHNMRLEGLSPQSVEAILSPAQDGSRFAWQNTATEALSRLRETTTAPVLILNLAATGAGKTRMNAKAMCALARGPVRFAVTLNLRALTLQTGDAMRQQLSVAPDELAVVIGDPRVQRLHAASSLPSMNPDAGVDEDENPALEEFGAYGDPFEVPGWLEPWVQHPREKQRILIGAPLLVSTIDYLVAAGEPHKQQHHVNALLRLLSGSDLVIDEIDGYEPQALIAVLRLVQAAALCGRNVLASSATLAAPVAEAVHAAFAAGVMQRRAMTGEPPEAGVNVALISDTQAPMLLTPDTNFSAGYKCYVDAGIRHLDATRATYRLAAVWPMLKVADSRKQRLAQHFRLDVAQRRNRWFSRAAAAVRHLHDKHAWPFGNTGKRVSFGLVRVANIQVAVALARRLAGSNASGGPVLRVACYHSQELLIQRHMKERRLDHLLHRHSSDQHILNDTEIAGIVETSASSDIIFVVVATPVEEIGRDHDFDWAVIEPSSAQSIVQTAGRVNRHRLRLIKDPNVLILEYNFRAMVASDAGMIGSAEGPYWRLPVFQRPGLEQAGRLYTMPSGEREVSMRRLLGERFVVDARLRFCRDTYRLAQLDDDSIAKQTGDVVQRLTSAADHPHPGLLTQRFYEGFPLRSSEPRQTLRLAVENGIPRLERLEFTVSGFQWIERRAEIREERPHPDAWLAWDLDELIGACKTQGLSEEDGLRLETRWMDDLSRLTWDRSFGWLRVLSHENDLARAASFAHMGGPTDTHPPTRS